MFDTPVAKAFVAIGVAAGAVGLAVDLASWPWYAAPALILPAGLCAAGVAVYVRARSRELGREEDDTFDGTAL